MRGFPLIAVALLAPTVASAQPFDDISATLGLPSSAIPPTGSGLIAGSSFADVDGDGDLDLVRSGAVSGVRLYRRDGATFTWDATAFTQVAGTEHMGHTLFDMDGDGDPDALVLTSGESFLFENVAGAFVDVTASHLPVIKGWASSAAAGDLDGDGDLDLVVARYIDRVEFPVHIPAYSLVFENDGGGRFSDRTRDTGFIDVRGAALVTALVDLDDDLDLDVVFANDFAQFTNDRDRPFGQALWLNDGDFVFREVAREVGWVAPVYAMGVAIADGDQDGRLDLVLSNIGEPMAFTREPDGHLSDALARFGLGVRFGDELNLATWNTAWEDLDADGHLDLVMAAGNLGAAQFIANDRVQQTVILRGSAAGRLTPLDAADVIVDPSHSARDIDFEDLDGDGRAELVLTHINSRVSALRNTRAIPRATTLALAPRTTGPGAAGALISGEACGVTRTRHVVGGAFFGSADRGVVRLAWPDCPEGSPASVDVRWPSGFVQRVTTTTGASLHVDEPAWLTHDASHVTIDLRAHVGVVDSVSVSGAGLVLAALEPIGERQWHAAWSLVAGRDEGVLTVDVDGRAWGAHPRLRVSPAPPVFIAPPTPIVDQEMRVHVAPGTNVTWRGGNYLAKSDGVVTMPVGATTGTFPLVIVTDGVSVTRMLEVAPPIDLARSDLMVRDLHVLTELVPESRVRLRVRLNDANGVPAQLLATELGLLVDGAPFVDPEITREGDWWSIRADHALLADGARLDVTLAGEPVFGPQYVAHISEPADVGALIDPERSSCWLSEPRLWAGTADRGTVYAYFVDRGGTRIADVGVYPTWTAIGATIVPDSDLQYGQQGFVAQVRAGVDAGSVIPIMPGQVETFACPVPMSAPPDLGPVVDARVLPVDASLPQVGVETWYRVVPLAASGRAVGALASPRVEAEGALVTSLEYGSFGRFDLFVVPTAVEMTLRVYEGELELASFTTEVVEPEPEPDADPEPSPETSPEPEPEPEPESPDASPEPEPESPDASPEPEPESPDASPEPEPESPEPSPEPEPESPEPSPEPEPESPDVVGGSDTRVDPADATTSAPTDAAELADASPERRRRDDDGCAGGSSTVLASLLCACLSLARSAWRCGARGRARTSPRTSPARPDASSRRRAPCRGKPRRRTRR